MRMTPLDIQNHRFATRLRGVDPEEVETFLRLVADDVEGLVIENDGLRARIATVELRVGELEAQERALRETLITAQALADDLKRTAVKESEVMIGQAEVRAEKILDAAHRRASRLAEDIREMKVVRSRIATAVRSTIETHLQLLDGLVTDDSEAPRAELLAAPLPRTEHAARAENARIAIALTPSGETEAVTGTHIPSDGLIAAVPAYDL